MTADKPHGVAPPAVDAVHAPVITLHPTGGELLAQQKTGDVKQGDLARFLAAIKAHYELLGHARPEHQSANNAPVSVEVIAIIGKVLAGRETWSRAENEARAVAAGRRDVQLRHIADEMKRLHPKIRGAKRFAELIVEAAKNNPEVKKQ